jgi:hypothetical protein
VAKMGARGAEIAVTAVIRPVFTTLVAISSQQASRRP